MTRLLAWLDADDPETWASKLLVFERVFVMTVGVEYWARAIPKWKLTAPSPALRVGFGAFLERWRWLGALAHPDAFARQVFEALPAWTRVRIELYHSHLDAETLQ